MHRRRTTQILRMKTDQLRHAIWSCRKRRERGHQVTPHSLILSLFRLLPSSSFLLFSLSFFSCRLNCSFPFIIAFCFGFFSHFPHSPMFPLSSCFVCATVPPTRRHHRRPCGGLTSLGLALVMLGWAHHPSWWFPLCRAVLGN